MFDRIHILDCFCDSESGRTLYGTGRKALSRAFRNRFVELHFGDMPQDELETILTTRCVIAPSYAQRLVNVYRKLTEQRQQSRMFEARHGFITLRDMFRWASRGAVGYQELAEHGYMLLAERVRNPGEKVVVKSVLEKVMQVKIDENELYSVERLEAMPEYQAYLTLMDDSSGSNTAARLPRLAWTHAMRRLFILVALCLRHHEPVLLVGETGCGKTTVCQILAATKRQELRMVNCHQNTETSDLLGGQRPLRDRARISHEARTRLLDVMNELSHIPEFSQQVTALAASDDNDNDDDDGSLEGMPLMNLKTVWNKLLEPKNPILLLIQEYAQSHPELAQKISLMNEVLVRSNLLFEWCDGPLVQAMKKGDLFLLDEISLADDSVLERLNSVLEPSRFLMLAEKASSSQSTITKSDSDDNIETLTATDGFEFLATMNPGGDYGKRELSPALRNRFTELWVPAISGRSDLELILSQRLSEKLTKLSTSITTTTNIDERNVEKCSRLILDYVFWLVKTLAPSISKSSSSKINSASDHDTLVLSVISLRDYLAWTYFIASTQGW